MPIDADLRAVHELAATAADAASAKNATDVVILDVGEILGIADLFVLMSARNERLLATVTEEIQQRCRRDHGRVVVRREGEPSSGWIILDFGDVVVHAFVEEQRDFYQLERLWSDAPRVPWSPTVPVGAAAGGRPW